jgi:integrase
MAIEKVSVSRKYHGKVPKDCNGNPLPKNEWSKKRPYRWAVRWFASDGTRYSRSFKTRKEAERFAEEKQADVREGTGDEPKPITLKEFKKVYLSLRGDVTEGTRVEHARALKYLGEHFGRGQLINEIRPLDARRFVSWYRKRKHRDRCPAPATVNKMIRECRRIFREAMECSLVRSNPFDGIRQEKVGQPGWQYVDPKHFQALIKASPSLRWRGMITLAYCCGLRQGEILNLTWGDVDFEGQRIRVVRKTAADLIKEWTPKDKDLRIVPLPDAAVNVLAEMQLEANERQTYVFVNSKGPAVGDRIKRQNLPRGFQALRRRAGVPKCTFHDLRKSYCTNLAGAVPLHVVQELAGHADIRTTRKHYLQVRPELIDAARKAVDEVITNASVTE